MPRSTLIDPALPVVEVIRLYPAARAVLARHGLDTCCGGAHPLAMAAAAHEVPLDPILEEIAAAVEAGHASEGAGAGAGEEGAGPVTAGMSVREIMARWPRTAIVFGRHGLMGCGGAEGPDEPVGWFAKVHDVEGGRLLRELNDAARGAKVPVAAAGPPAKEPPTVYPPFLKTAFLFTFTGGTTLGVVALILMALRGKLGGVGEALIQSHGHVQLYGWVAIFIMGVAYHILPRLKGGDLPGTFLPNLSLAAMTAGVVLRGAAQAADLGSASRVAYLAGGNLEVLAVLLFLSLAAPLLALNPSRERFERWLSAGNLFFALATFIQVGAVAALFAYGTLAVPAFIETPFLGVFLLGFVGYWILGVSARTLPVFMGLPRPSAAGQTFAFWALSAGVPILALGQGIFIASGGGAASRALLAAGALLAGAGMIAFPVATRVFSSPEAAGRGMEADRGYEKFVRASYAWLVVSALTLLGISGVAAATGAAVPHAYVGAFRHALTVGFITTMMVGMGSRIIPIFSGIPLRSAAAREWSFWLILTGCAVRVGFQSLSEPFGPTLLKLSGVSGVLELAGMVLFAWNTWPALRPGRSRALAPPPAAGPGAGRRLPVVGGAPVSPRAAAEGVPIEASTSVGRLLEARPDLIEVFVETGFVQLANPFLRATVARYVTIARACAMHGVDVDGLLARLRGAAAPAAAPAGAAAGPAS